MSGSQKCSFPIDLKYQCESKSSADQRTNNWTEEPGNHGCSSQDHRQSHLLQDICRWADLMNRSTKSHVARLTERVPAAGQSCRLNSFRITSFSADHVSSTAHTLTSTRPSGNAASRIVSSVISDATPEDRLGQDTQMAPACFMSEQAVARTVFSSRLELVNTCHKSMLPFIRVEISTSSGIGARSSR